MEALKKESRYGVWPYENPKLVDVMADENGNVYLYWDEEDEKWYMDNGGVKYFTSEMDAMNYCRSCAVTNKEAVKKYLDHIGYDDDKLKEIMPEWMYIDFKEGRGGKVLDYNEYNVMLEAVAGRFNINGVTFRASEVSHVMHMKDKNFRIVLKDGTKVDTGTSVERRIVEAAFGYNHSGKIFK